MRFVPEDKPYLASQRAPSRAAARGLVVYPGPADGLRQVWGGCQVEVSLQGMESRARRSATCWAVAGGELADPEPSDGPGGTCRVSAGSAAG